jgi:glucosamine--fructose-6-phosphate aminotransferase (isomerizing)
MTYRSMIAAQPDTVAQCLKTARTEIERIDLAPFAHGTIAVTGIGASFAASIVVAAELARRGRRAIAVRSVDLIGASSVADSIIALSHRGRSIETVESLRAHPATPALAITNDADSPLAKAAGRHVRIANERDATPSTTGYTGTLAACGALVDRLCGTSAGDRAALPAQLAEVLAAAALEMPRLATLFRNRRAIDSVGAGASLGTAEGACLLLREAARIPAAAADTRHYLHGPMEAMDPTTGVIVFGDDRELQLARQLDDIGCPVLLVTSQTVADRGGLTAVRVPATGDRIRRGILDILSAQLLAAELSDAAGLTDVKFRYPQADTKVP